MKIETLKNAQKKTTAKGDVFLDLAGREDYKYKILSGLKIDINYESQYRAPSIPHPYLEVVSDMEIDRSYSNFYHSVNSRNTQYSNLTEALNAYNNSIKSASQSEKQAQKYLISNIPIQTQELQHYFIKTGGYGYTKGDISEAVVFATAPSKEGADKEDILIYANGKFGIGKNIPQKENGKLDLSDTSSIKFEITDFQEALDSFVQQTQTLVQEEETRNIDGKIEVSPESLLEKIGTYIQKYQEKNELAKNRNLVFSTPLNIEDFDSDKVVVPLREINIEDYVVFSGRNSAQSAEPVETGNYEDFLISKKDFNNMLEQDLGYKGAIGNGRLELDLNFEQIKTILNKTKKTRENRESKPEEAIYSARSIGEELKKSKLNETDLDKIIREVIDSERLEESKGEYDK